MCQVKRLFDPEGLMNPGKITGAPPMTSNLREAAPPPAQGILRNSTIRPALMSNGARVCGAFGYLNERIAYRPLRNAPRIASLITAIGVSFLLEYGGQLVFGPDPKFFPTLTPKHIIHLGGIVTTNYQIIVLIVAVIFMALLQWIIYGTKFGRAMRAVSYNFETASLMGIPVDRVISTTFVIGSSLAAVAGILFGLSYPKIDPLMGIMPGLKAFIAAVLGGIGNVQGAVVGGLTIGIVEAFVGGSRFSNFRDAIAFVILIAILLFRPSGLFGKYEAEKV